MSENEINPKTKEVDKLQDEQKTSSVEIQENEPHPEPNLDAKTIELKTEEKMKPKMEAQKDVKSNKNKGCGYSQFRNKLKPIDSTLEILKPIDHVLGQAAIVPVYSCYLGLVPLPCTDLGGNNISLMSTQHSPIGPNVLVKQVSGRLNNLDPNQQYSLDYLKNLPTVVVNVQQCEANWHIIQNLKPLANKTQDQINQLYNAMSYNNSIDAMFLMCKGLEFMHMTIGINSVTPDNCLLGIVDVPNFDNAFWNGQNMLFGDGVSLLWPTADPTVTLHEVGHGIIEAISALGYDEEASMLNESFADIIGTMFNYWFSLQSVPSGEIPVQNNWLIGADAARNGPCIRDLSNPNAYQQPFNYKGWFWAPMGSDLSYAAHCNSSICSFLFYKATEAMGGRDASFTLFLNCLKQLPQNASYRDLRDIMTRLGIPQSCLDATSLTADQNFDY